MEFPGHLPPYSYYDHEIHHIDGSLPLGFDDMSGLLWAVMCLNTPHGNVAGKLDKDQKGFYVWGGREHECLEWEQIEGTLYTNRGEIPNHCQPLGDQHDSGESHYNVVVQSEHGMIPGKGLRSSDTAWYGYQGVEMSTQDNFYYLCQD